MKSLLIGGLALAFSISPAHAQLSPSASGFSSAPTDASEVEYWTMMRRLGACLADSKTAAAQAFLATSPDTDEEGSAFQSLFHRNSNRCMGNFVSASMRRAYLRGMIAEGLFKQMPEAQRARGLAKETVVPDAIGSLHDFAQCYVAKHQRDAIVFLEGTKVATKGELEAVRHMAADFGPCFPEGKHITINPDSIRMAVAEALYRAASR